jgi:cytoskeletal protein CcmA (bactofilin family)
MVWGSDKRNAASRASAGVESLIGNRTSIRGDIEFAGGLHVDGHVKGTLVSDPAGDGTLIVSDKGSIEGEIRAPHVVVNGRVTGDIWASERVELAANARVNGNIHYKVLEMAAGAQVTGQLFRTDEPLRQLPAPSAIAAETDQTEDVAAHQQTASRATNGKTKVTS